MQKRQRQKDSLGFVASQFSLIGKFQAIERCWKKNQGRETIEEDTQIWPLASMCVCMHLSAHKHIQKHILRAYTINKKEKTSGTYHSIQHFMYANKGCIVLISVCSSLKSGILTLTPPNCPTWQWCEEGLACLSGKREERSHWGRSLKHGDGMEHWPPERFSGRVQCCLSAPQPGLSAAKPHCWNRGDIVSPPSRRL